MLRRRQAVLFVIAVVLVFRAASCLAQEGDDAAQRAIAERFIAVLEKNPRRGTAFDKVYGYHVEHGSLNELLKRYQDRANQNDGPASATAWLIIGLIESQRGRDVDAVRALTNAERLDPTSAMASWQLGQTLVMTGQTDLAAAAFERAIQRQPATADLMEIYQALGRVYQRAQKNELALDAWNRLESQFPNDSRVQEQIATVLLEENELAAALPRFERLAANARDKQRQSLFQVEAADIKVKLGRTDDGLQDFDRLLKQLNPESWLFRDIRRRIEAVYRKNNNPAGLITYYEKWIDQDPDDLDAISRLARLLVTLGRGPEAELRLQQALKRAPSNRELRLGLINQLLSSRKYHDAVDQFRELEKHDPNNPDVLREWGRAVLKDELLEDDQRHQEASRVWRKMLAARPQDPHVASQVADLFRRAGMVDEALELFRQAIRLAPDAGQYREYLGEYLRSLDRLDEALATWREMAVDHRKTAPNLARLAEILAANGRLEEAIETNVLACQLDPKDLNLQLKRADLLMRGDKHEAALNQLASVSKLATTDEEREAVLQRELAALNTLNRLKARISELRASLESDPAPDPRLWYWLARAHDVAGQPREGLLAIQQGLQLSPDSIPMLTAAAQFYESLKQYKQGVEIYTRLAGLDRRFRSEHLKRIAILEEKRGRVSEALQAGRDYVTSAAGNPGASDFFAALCFRQGQHEEGIQILRRSLRMNPGDQETLIKLAMALVNREQSTEAIELLWRAFDRAKSLEDRLSIVQVLAETHAQRNQLNKLYIRLERDRRDPALFREMTLCLGRAYETVGDLATAQRKLESLAVEGTRDTDLLTHLRTLAERQRDFAAAARFQRQLWQITGNSAERYRLAEFLFQANREEALELLSSAAGDRELNAELLKLLDGMYQRKEYERLATRLKILRAQFPQNWELLYREAVALSHASPAEAVKRFDALLQLNCPEEDPSLLSPKTSSLPAIGIPAALPLPLVSRLSSVPRFQAASQMQAANRARGLTSTPSPVNLWVNPHDYGTARMAAWGWLLKLARPTELNAAEFVDLHAPSKSQPSTARQRYIDLISLHTFLANNEQKRDVIRKLMQLSEDDVEARVLFLQSVRDRRSGVNRTPVLSFNGRVESAPPLDNASLDEVIRVYRSICERPDLIPLNVVLLHAVITELVQGRRRVDASQLFEAAVQRATDPREVSQLMQFEQQSSDMVSTRRLLDLMIEHSARGTSAGQMPPDLVAARLVPLLKGSNHLDDMLAVWKQYLRLATDDVRRHAIAGQTGPAQHSTFQGTVTFTSGGQIHYVGGGGQIFHISGGPGNTETAEQPGIVYGDAPRSLLSAIRRQFRAHDRSNELITRLTAEVEAAERTTVERLYWQHALAYVQWNAFENDAFFKILEIAAEDYGSDRLPNQFDLKAGLVRQYEQVHKPARALTLLDSTAGPLTRDNEKKALHLALAAGNGERAKTAVQRLTAERVEHQELVKLAPPMIELGLNEQVEEMLLRTAQTESLDLAPLWILMDVQLKLGKKSEAAQTALDTLHILDHLRPGGSAGIITYELSHGDGRPLSIKTSVPAELRQRCHEVLLESGQLKAIIEANELTLKTTSPTEKLLTQTIGLLSIVGDTERSGELTLEKLKLECGDSPNRFPLIMKYLELERFDEAQTQMKVMIKADSQEFASRCRDFLFRLKNGRSLVEFARQLAQLDWCANDTTLMSLSSIVNELHKRPATEEVGDELFVLTWKAHPEHQAEIALKLRTERVKSLIVISESQPTALVQYFENLDKTRPLMLPLTIRSNAAEGQFRCLWDDAWPGIVRDEGLTTRMSAALQRQREIRKDDLTLLILSAQFAAAARHDELVTTLTDQIIQAIESRRANPPETNVTPPAFLADEFALWLVALRCLNQSIRVEQAELLGQRALRACQRAGKFDLGRVILNEWIQIADKGHDEIRIDRLKEQLEAWPK